MKKLMLVLSVMLAFSLMWVSVNATYTYEEGERIPSYVVKFIKEDPNYPVNVMEVNSTYTKFCVKSKISGVEIPLKTYTLTEEIKAIDEEEYLNFKDVLEEKCYKVHVNDILKTSFSFGLSTTEWEYEETYDQVGVVCANPNLPAANEYDGNWGTAGSTLDGTAGWHCSVYENYTKPGADEYWQLVNTTQIRYRMGSIGAGGENITLPAACWNNTVNNSVLMLWIQDYCYDEGNRDNYFRCYNGTGWSVLDYLHDTANIYETGVYWNFERTEEWYDDHLLMKCSEEGISGVSTPLIFHNYYEANQTIANGTLDMTFDILNPGENQTSSYSFEFASNETHSICMYPAWASYQVDMMAEYDADGFERMTYYFDNETIDNSTDDINLYLLDEADGEALVVYVRDSSSQLRENITIQQIKYFLGTGEDITITVLKTNSDGKAITHVDLDTTWYKWVLIQDGSAVRTYSAATIPDTSADPEELTLYLAPTEYEFYHYIDEISYVCDEDETAKTINCTVTDGSELMTSFCVKVMEWGATGYTEECYSCNTTSGGQVGCQIAGETGNKTYAYQLISFFPGGYHILTTGYISFLTSLVIWGQEGVLAAMLIVMTMAFVGLWSPSASIVGGTVGLIVSVWLNLIVLSPVIVVGIIIVAGIMAIKGKY